jgi:hypothetical protein
MNYYNACSILEIENNEVTIENLKKQYRRKALQYHPDKNKSENASAMFININNAYEYLLKYLDSDIDIDSENINNGYVNTLFTFLQNILGSDSQFNDIKNKLFYMIVNKIANSCENKAFELLEKIDKKIIIKIADLFFKYKEVFHFSEGFLGRLEILIANKIKDDECIILNPFLEDLFENNLFKLTENESTYYIPLWHHELLYDNDGNDLYIKCIPILPENVTIDTFNNIHVYVTYNLFDIWGKNFIEFEMGKKKFSFFTEDLKLKENQQLILPNVGISRINTENIYDISVTSDVFIHFTLFLEN